MFRFLLILAIVGLVLAASPVENEARAELMRAQADYIKVQTQLIRDWSHKVKESFLDDSISHETFLSLVKAVNRDSFKNFEILSDEK